MNIPGTSNARAPPEAEVRLSGANHRELRPPPPWLALSITSACSAAMSGGDVDHLGVDTPHYLYTRLRRNATSTLFAASWGVAAAVSDTTVMVRMRTGHIVRSGDSLVPRDRLRRVPRSMVDLIMERRVQIHRLRLGRHSGDKEPIGVAARADEVGRGPDDGPHGGRVDGTHRGRAGDGGAGAATDAEAPSSDHTKRFSRKLGSPVLLLRNLRCAPRYERGKIKVAVSTVPVSYLETAVERSPDGPVGVPFPPCLDGPGNAQFGNVERPPRRDGRPQRSIGPVRYEVSLSSSDEMANDPADAEWSIPGGSVGDIDQQSRAHGQLPHAGPADKARTVKSPGEMTPVPAYRASRKGKAVAQPGFWRGRGRGPDRVGGAHIGSSYPLRAGQDARHAAFVPPLSPTRAWQPGLGGRARYKRTSTAQRERDREAARAAAAESSSSSTGSAALQGAAESPAAAATPTASLGPLPPHDADGAAPPRKRCKGSDSAVHNPDDDDQRGGLSDVVGGERGPSCDQVAAADNSTNAAATGDPRGQPGIVGQGDAVSGLEGADEDKGSLSSAVGGEGDSAEGAVDDATGTESESDTAILNDAAGSDSESDRAARACRTGTGTRASQRPPAGGSVAEPSSPVRPRPGPVSTAVHKQTRLIVHSAGGAAAAGPGAVDRHPRQGRVRLVIGSCFPAHVNVSGPSGVLDATGSSGVPGTRASSARPPRAPPRTPRADQSHVRTAGGQSGPSRAAPRDAAADGATYPDDQKTPRTCGGAASGRGGGELALPEPSPTDAAASLAPGVARPNDNDVIVIHDSDSD